MEVQSNAPPLFSGNHTFTSCNNSEESSRSVFGMDLSKNVPGPSYAEKPNDTNMKYLEGIFKFPPTSDVLNLFSHHVPSFSEVHQQILFLQSKSSYTESALQIVLLLLKTRQISLGCAEEFWSLVHSCFNDGHLLVKYPDVLPEVLHLANEYKAPICITYFIELIGVRNQQDLFSRYHRFEMYLQVFRAFLLIWREDLLHPVVKCLASTRIVEEDTYHLRKIVKVSICYKEAVPTSVGPPENESCRVALRFTPQIRCF